MQDFVIREIVTKDIESELEKVGFDIAYRAKASDKFRYKTIKILDLTLPQANILKQTALSYGADCGVHRDVLTNNVEKTDVLLGGSYSQLKKISKSLEAQPFAMKKLAEQILNELDLKPRKTKLVGILNLTPNSFSNDGFIDSKLAIEHFYKLVEDGADVVDIGAESTKPFAEAVSSSEQIKRLEPVLREINKLNVQLSIDTRNSEVARFALDYGVDIINDTSGLTNDSKILEVVSKYNAGIIIQHSTQKTEDKVNYNDVIEEVYLSLLEKSNLAKEKGVKNIIIDVGIGFGKDKQNNFDLINRIEEFYSLNLPIMVGLSRKSLLGLADSTDNSLKDSLSAALSYPLMQKGVDFLRVHNVKLHRQLLDLAI